MSRIPGADNSGTLFDHIKTKKKLERELELAQYLDEHPSVISEIRHGKRQLNSTLILKICTVTGMSLKSVQTHIATAKE